MLTRRSMLAMPAAFATSLFSSPSNSKTPNSELEKLGAIALEEARRLKATYADIRINRYRSQNVFSRASPDPSTGKTLEVPGVFDDDSFGFGVRVIADGSWGFAASPVVTPEQIRRITGEAVTVARGNSTLKGNPILLAPAKAYRERWTSPFERNPFDVPVAERMEFVHSAVTEVKKQNRVFSSWDGVSSELTYAY